MTTIEQVINKVRDVLRVEAITGIDSINHCIFFAIVRYLDEPTCKLLGIDTEYCFEQISKLESDTDLFAKIYNPVPTPPSLALYICQKLGYTNIKGNFKVRNTRNLRSIINTFAKIDLHHYTSEYDLIGFIYELHLKSGTSNSMRDLGQYFTPRSVIKYMVELCNPQLGEIILDGTCGTGGFLTMAVKFLNQNNPNIDWSLYQNKIYGFDIDQNVHNLARVNLFIETGQKCTNICKRNTLIEDLKDDQEVILEGADVQLINEPMGLKGIKFGECCKRIQDLKMRGSKAEPLFLQLFMQSLNKGGRSAIVVPDGILFNENAMYKNTRKYLIEHFDLKKVIQIPNGLFLNTNVKLSILFFSNTGKTNDVEFTELFIDNQGKTTENTLLNVEYDTIKQNGYSLTLNKYKVKETIKFEGVRYIKFGEVFTLKSGKLQSTKIEEDNDGTGFFITKAPFEDWKKINTNRCTLDGDNLFIGKVSNGNRTVPIRFYSGQCDFSNIIYNIQPKEIYKNMTNLKYFYYYFLSIKEYIEQTYQLGSCTPHLDVDGFNQMEIPIPDLSIQNKIVQQIDQINQNTDVIRKLVESNKIKIKNYMDLQLEMYNVEMVKLGEVFTLKSGKLQSTKIEADVDGNGLFVTKAPFEEWKKINTNRCTLNGDNLFIGKVSNGNRTLPIRFYSGKCDFSNIIYNVQPNEIYKNTTNLKYFYYYLQSIKEYIEQSYQLGSCTPHLDVDGFNQMELPIPEISIQNKIVQHIDKIVEINKQLEKQIENNHQMVTDIMNTYLNKKCETNDTVQEDSPTKTELRSECSKSPVSVNPTTSPSSETKKPTPKSKTKTSSPTNTCQSINKKTKQPCKNKAVAGKLYCKRHLPDEVVDDEVVDD